MIIICNYLNSSIGEYSPIDEFVIIRSLFVIIEVIWSEITMNLRFIWWLLDWLFAADNPNNQKSENKMWIPRPFLTKILTHDMMHWHQLLFDLFVIICNYLTLIWWLFDEYLMIFWIKAIICYIEILHFYVHVAKV